MMSIVLAESIFEAVRLASFGSSRNLIFDLSDPKIIIGLMLGALTPYLILATLATITKWLILRLILQKEARPKIRRLIAVALLEVSYVFVAVALPELVDMRGLSAFSISSVPLLALGMLCNLPLLPGRNQPDGAANSLLKKCLLAFGLGLIYWGYLVLILFSFHVVLDGASS